MMVGHKKRKQDSDAEQDIEYSASDSEAPAKKATRPKSTTAKEKTSVKAKTVKKPRINHSEEKSLPSHEESNEPTVHVLKSAEGEKYMNLGKNRRATVRPFKGQLYIDIREFYGTEGDEKPGKKGISLTIEQWDALKHSITTIDSLVAEQSGKK